VPTPGGGGQVLIKSVNGKVVITPVPGTGNNPPLPPAPAATAPAVAKPASPMTVATKAGGGGGGGLPVVNGGGEQHNSNNCNSSGDNGQVGLHSFLCLKGLSYEIDFENVDENWQILALIRAVAGF
jgi:hypothetical protein